MNRSRSSRLTVDDLELRLAPSHLLKGGTLAANCLRGCPEIILIEDDDDDVMQLYPPVHPPNAFRRSPYTNFQEDAIREEDLELRLGVGASHLRLGNSNCEASRLGVDFKDASAWKCGKAPCSQSFSEVKLRCTICMDTMKEETSTICGHLFCHRCIANAILAQRKCPTCRRKLSLGNIHRIYLPGPQDTGLD